MTFTKKQIIMELKDAYNKCGPFMKNDITKLSSFCKETVINHFGSVNNAGKIAGIKFKKINYYKSEEHRRKISKSLKGKSMEELLGKERAQSRAKKISDKLKGNKNNGFELNKNLLIREIQEKYKLYGAFCKKDFNKIIDICTVTTARNRFGSLDELAEIANIRFIKPKIIRDRVRLGKNETQILDDIEKENNIKLERSFYVAGKFIDGYDTINNVAYEVDEPFHKYRKIEDAIRENKIKNVLSCDFIRIQDNGGIKNG